MPTWPPANTSAYLSEGYTSIRWGTDGMLTNYSSAGGATVDGLSVSTLGGATGTPGGGVLPGNATYGGFFIVESIRGQDEIENIYIEQGTGLKATRIQLWQGRNYTITVTDDTNMSPPSPGGLVTICDPISGGGNTYSFRVTQNAYNTGRKVEGKREITCEYLTLIEGSGTPPAA